MTHDPSPRGRPAGTPPRRGLAFARLLAAGVLAVFAFDAAVLALEKSYSIDELTYAHASWAVAHGMLPFRDFFFHHLPLLPSLGALPMSLAPDHPGSILLLRLMMLPFFALTALAAFRLNRDRDGPWALLAPAFLLATYEFAVFATEIRPDSVAFALWLSALALLRTGARAALRGAGAGALFALSVWASEKAAVYGSVLLAAWLLDVAWNRRRGGRILLAHPAAFVAGGLAVVAAALVYLTATGSWASFWRWGVQWPLIHQEHYPGFSWLSYFRPLLVRGWWLWPLAAIGAAAAWRGLRAGGRPASHPDLLLLAGLATTFASFALQGSAYPYSLIPFAGLLAVFAGRGAAACFRRAAERAAREPRGRAVALAVALAVIFALPLVFAHRLLRARAAIDNDHQHRVFDLIDRLTDPADPVYDNSGGYVARPHVSFFYFTDRTVRRLLAPMLEREMPAAIVRSGCTVYLHDIRFDGLPPALKSFVISNFQPYSGDLYLWGRRYETAANGLPRAPFFAVRSAEYFVDPPALLDGGRLWIDGEEITAPAFKLEAGEHEVRYEGPAESFSLLWLPRDGRRWRPRPDEQPSFSRLF